MLSWFQLRGGILESNFSTTFVKYAQKPFAIVTASVVIFPSTVIGKYIIIKKEVGNYRFQKLAYSL